MSGQAPDDIQQVIQSMAEGRVDPGYGVAAPPGQNAQYLTPDPADPAAQPSAPLTPAEAFGIAPPSAPPQFPPSVAPLPPVAPPPPATQPDWQQQPAQPQPTPPAGAPDVTLPDGSTITRDDLQRALALGGSRLQELAYLDHAFKTRPDVQAAMQQAMGRGGLFPAQAAPPVTPPVALPPTIPGPPQGPPTGTAGYPPAPFGSPPPLPAGVAPAPPTLPADVDADDPTVRWVLSQRAELEGQIQQQRQVLQQAQSANLTSSLSRARSDAQAKYPNLTADDWANLEGYATQMGFAGGHYSTHGDFYEAARFALETAAETIPDQGIRSRLSARPATTVQDRQRQQALSALAGTGAPSPRTDQQQPVTRMTNDQRLTGMTRELEAYAQSLQST